MAAFGAFRWGSLPEQQTNTEMITDMRKQNKVGTESPAHLRSPSRSFIQNWIQVFILIWFCICVQIRIQILILLWKCTRPTLPHLHTMHDVVQLQIHDPDAENWDPNEDVNQI